MAETRKVTLTIPAALAEHFDTLAETAGVTGHTLMARLLTAAKDIDFASRPLIVPAPARRDIEALAETTIETAPQLVALLKNLLRIDMGEVTVYLTERQADKFAEFATYYDEPLDEYMSAKLTDAINYVLGEW